MSDPSSLSSWSYAVYETVQRIPYGKVTTYGHIARILGEPQRPRQVGTALRHLPSSSSSLRYTSTTVPWHRVINSRGMISHREPGGAARQAARLREEGVEVQEDVDGLGGWGVELDVWGWFEGVEEEEAQDGE